MKHGLKRLAKSTLIYGVGVALNRLIGFLLLPVFTSYLTPTDYGISSILGVLVQVVTPLFSLGVGAALAVCYFENNNRYRREATVWTAFVILACSASVLAVLGSIFARELSSMAFGTPAYHYLTTVSLWSACVSIPSVPFGLYLQFEEKARTFVVVTTISALISIGLSVVMVVVLGRGVNGLIESGFMGQAITLALFLVLTGPHMSFRWDWPLGHELLRVGIPLIPGFAFVFVLQHGVKYILQWFNGLDAVGVFTVGFNLGATMALLISGLQTAWVPYFMSFVDERDQARIVFGRVLTYYMFGFGALSLLFYILAKPVVMVMTQPAFLAAHKVVGLSASTYLLFGVFSLLLPGMYFAKETNILSVIQGLAAVVGVGLDLVLIRLFGLLGAAIALVLGVLIMTVLVQAWNVRRKREYVSVRYEWDRLGRFSLVYLAYVVLMLWERDLTLLREVYLSTAAGAVLPILLYGLLTREERDSVRVMGRQLVAKMAGVAMFKA